jgi:hypothetical protein
MASTQNNILTNIFSLIRLQFSETFADVQTYLINTFNQSGKVFTNSSAYGQILYVLMNMQELIFYYIEDSVVEQNIYTASRADSVRGLARLAGHDAVRSIAATGELSFQWTGYNPGTIASTTIIIPNYTTMLCLNNGLSYILNLPQEEIRVQMTSLNPSVNGQIAQGEIQSQTFTSTGEPLQSFEVIMNNGRMIDQFFNNVYVNGEQWQVYDSIYDMPKDAQGVLVKTGIGSGCDIYFGNSYFGAIPELGASIRFEYLVTDGEAGNLRDTTNIVFEFQENGYDLTGNEVDLTTTIAITVALPVEFGTNMEPLAMTRLLAPKTSRSFVLANPDNYVIFLEKYNYFSQIYAYSSYDDQYLDDLNVIYIFLVPDIQKRLFNDENYFTVPIQYFSLSATEVTKVDDLLTNSGSTIAGSEVVIVQPTIQQYVVNVSLVVFEGYSTDLIIQQIITKFSAYFIAIRRRDRIPVSELIAIVEGITGVDSVSVFFVSEANEANQLVNPGADIICLDEYGDIIIGRNELSLIRGGWTDRYGTFFEDSASTQVPSSINIEIRDTVPQDYNARVNQNNVQAIINS